MRAQLSRPAALPDLSTWSEHELRTVYFDFTQRGLGEPDIVEAALREWDRRGTLAARDAAYWLDAIAWRDAQGLLPGWAMATASGESVGSDEDEARFREWRAQAA